MSRFGPRVQPEGVDWGAAIREGLMMHREARDRKLARERQQEQDRRQQEHDQREQERHEGWQKDREYQQGQRVRAERAQDLAEHEAGIRQGQAPNPLVEQLGQLRERMQRPMGVQGIVPDAPEAPIDFGGAAAATARYRPIGADRYVDTQETPAAREVQRQQSAHARLGPDAGEFVPGVDYLGQIGETFRHNRTVQLEGAKHANEVDLEGVRHRGRREIAGMDNSTTLEATRIREQGANARHDRPSASSTRSEREERGKGGITWNQALEHARELSTDIAGRVEVDEAGLVALAERLYNGDRTRPKGVEAGDLRRGERKPAPPPAPRAAAPIERPAPPVDSTQIRASMAEQRTMWDQAFTELTRRGLNEMQILEILKDRP